jgi:O-antigen ligase
MRISTPNNTRSGLISASVLIMLACLFISRAALSISMILFFVLTIVNKRPIHQLNMLIKDPVLLVMSFLFIIPFVSALWSKNINNWEDIIRIKLPLILFPVAFAGSWQLTTKQWQKTGSLFLILIFAGCCWSLIQYLENTSAFNDAYLKAKTINTPLENDHVRFSWLIVVGIVYCFIQIERATIKPVRILFIFIILFFITYLHILAARTGIFCLYIFLFLYLIRALVKKATVRTWIIIISTVIIVPLLSWFTLPTFQNRIKYFLYDISFVRNNSYLPGSNDGARFISIRAGWHVIQKHPFGAGAGDIRAEMENWYPQHVPNIINTDKFYPCSEWIMYGGFAGWPGMILFTMIMLILVFYKTKTNHFYWIVLNSIAAFSFVFDIGLENQFGVFIYSFIILWWYKWLNQNQDIKNG